MYTEDTIHVAASEFWILKLPKKLVLFYRGVFPSARVRVRGKEYWENVHWHIIKLCHTHS